ncbi:MAG: hypothetical protein DDT40_01671 [candidate division WS2 bacterium]|nr:hypothetical protein [Candidatus Psychracetigena formicireducens]
MGRRRTISIILIVFAIGLLLVNLTLKETVEGLYQKKVKDNYHSITDGRDILKIYMGLEVLKDGQKVEPDLTKDFFLKLPSIVEVAETKPLVLHYNIKDVKGAKPYKGAFGDFYCSATTPDMFKVANLELVEGRFLTWEDVEKERMVCVIEYMGDSFGVGNYLYFHNVLMMGEGEELTDNPLEVVGIVKTKTVFNYHARGWDDKAAYIPFSTAIKLILEEVSKPGFERPYPAKDLFLSRDVYLRVLDVDKGAREITEALKARFKELGKELGPAQVPTQYLTHEKLIRFPPWDNRPFHESYLPFTNHPLISLMRMKKVFDNLPFISLFLILIGVILNRWKPRALKE